MNVQLIPGLKYLKRKIQKGGIDKVKKTKGHDFSSILSKIYLGIDFAFYFPTQNLYSSPNHVTAVLRKKRSPA